MTPPRRVEMRVIAWLMKKLEHLIEEEHMFEEEHQ